MALFDSYTVPGVYTDVNIVDAGAPLFGTTRVPVIIGEGQESFTYSNVELHRGSSSTSDEQVVGENISSQVDGTRTTFQLGYYPVMTGDGSSVSNNPSDISVLADGNPVVVATLNGATGQFTSYDIPVGTDVVASYAFKRTDTLYSGEDLSLQIPTYATLAVQGLGLTLSVPGLSGNSVTLTFTLAATGSGVPDATAVTVTGNDVSVELRNTDDSIRAVNKVAQLVNVQTQSAGYIQVTNSASSLAALTGAASAYAKHNFGGGVGQNTNKTFKVKHVPIVDGSNGGVVTNNPGDVTVLVNGSKVAVASVDGANGLITLAASVNSGQSLDVTYHSNMYQNTYDVLPAENVSSISKVGLGPDRNDFVQGVDYVLDGTKIRWGAAATVAEGETSPDTVPFNGLLINTTLADDNVYLRKTVSGPSNSVNTVFTLADVPVDGSGLGKPTDDPGLIKVFVGTSPVDAISRAAVNVIRLSGATAQVTLQNPPTVGSFVYASYKRSALADHAYTFTATNPAATEYTIKDEHGNPIPVASITTTPGTLVFPYSLSDLVTGVGSPDETVTVKFEDDGLGSLSTGVQASAEIDGLVFTAHNVGEAPNGVTGITFVGGPGVVADSAAITVDSETLTVHITKTGGTRTLGDIIALFSTYANQATTPLAGSITVSTSLSDTSTTASASGVVLMEGGTDAVLSNTFANRFTVSSSSPDGSAGTGYLGQTYIDAKTGLRFTLVDSTKAVEDGYGYTSTPSGYVFQPNDEISITVSSSAPRVGGPTTPGGVPVTFLDIPGVKTQVLQLFQVGVGNTATLNTYSKSGNGPNVGDYYFITYKVNKTAEDMMLKMFTSAQAAYAVYGPPSLDNRLSLGIYLMTLNGAQSFGAIQVPKQAGLNTAADPAFNSAIQSLTSPLPGSNYKASVIVPLSTSPSVHQVLSRQLITQSSVRMKGEAIGFVGFDQFTTPTTARQYARSLKNSRVIAVAPFYASLQLPTQNANGTYQTIGVTGEFMAAALAGLELNPANDVATSLTNQNLVGFKQLLKRYDDTVKDLMAGDGITVLDENNGALYVRDYLSTDNSDAITSEPTSTTVVDYVRKQFRIGLKQFVSRKFTQSLLNDIQIVATAMLNECVANEILDGYKNLVVVPSPTDPTVALVTVAVKPMFALKYISVTFSVTTQL